VTAMHDFAGCRMIFNSIEELNDFRAYMHSSVVLKNVEHKLRHEPDKYDYIQSPKASGYRGIHDVYKHFPRGTSRKEEKKPWDGLLVELQYRTRAQHAWATAVEISDLLDGERTKFEMNQTERGRFFALASEIIARVYENETRAFIYVNTDKLKAELEELDGRLGLLHRLGLLRQFDAYETLLEHNVLSISIDDAGEYTFEARPFRKAADAISYATKLEAAGANVNAVYVRAEKPHQLRSAYRNYFYDPIDFVQMIRDA
jgi:putative GTP pyrophosphokinase